MRLYPNSARRVYDETPFPTPDPIELCKHHLSSEVTKHFLTYTCDVSNFTAASSLFSMRAHLQPFPSSCSLLSIGCILNMIRIRCDKAAEAHAKPAPKTCDLGCRRALYDALEAPLRSFLLRATS